MRGRGKRRTMIWPLAGIPPTPLLCIWKSRRWCRMPSPLSPSSMEKWMVKALVLAPPTDWLSLKQYVSWSPFKTSPMCSVPVQPGWGGHPPDLRTVLCTGARPQGYSCSLASHGLGRQVAGGQHYQVASSLRIKGAKLAFIWNHGSKTALLSIMQSSWDRFPVDRKVVFC